MATVLSAAALTTLAAVKARLSKTDSVDDEILNQLINNVSARAAKFDRSIFQKLTYTDEQYDGTGDWYLALDHRPIISISSITEDETVLTVTTDYEIDDASAGILRRVDAVWSDAEPRNIKITCVAGYCFSSIAAASFTGSGLNDLTSGGAYSGTADGMFTLVIDGTGATDTFKWRKDSGAWTTLVPMTMAAQALSDSVTGTFAAKTGHAFGDQWTIAVVARTVPWDLEDAIIRQICSELNEAKHNEFGVTSRSGPDGSQSIVDRKDWLDSVRRVLELYQNPISPRMCGS